MFGRRWGLPLLLIGFGAWNAAVWLYLIFGVSRGANSELPNLTVEAITLVWGTGIVWIVGGRMLGETFGSIWQDFVDEFNKTKPAYQVADVSVAVVGIGGCALAILGGLSLLVPPVSVIVALGLLGGIATIYGFVRPYLRKQASIGGLGS